MHYGKKSESARYTISAAISAWLGVSAGCAVLITFLLVRANPGRLGVWGCLDLALVMLWITLLLNACFSVPVLLARWVLVRFLRTKRDGLDGSFFVAGLVAINVVWALWNQLAMAHQWASVRPFTTFTGVIETLMLIAVGGCVWVALHRSGEPRRRAISFVALGGVVLLLTTYMLRWRDAEQRQHRTYTPTLIREAAGGVEATSPGPFPGSSRVILLAMDGFCWSVAVPLMKASRMPTLRRLVRDGSVGYLDNGEESLSPRIWTSVFTGRPVDEHGIHGFSQLTLSLSGRSLPELLLTPPSIDSFYGLQHLLHRLPKASLWSMDTTGTEDRLVPTVWEVASYYGRRVVIVNPVANHPVRPVNGAIVRLTHDPKAGERSFQPLELAARWGRSPLRGKRLVTEHSFERAATRFGEEMQFAIELFGEFDFDMGIFYSHFVDTVSHSNWDFHSRDSFYLSGLPRLLSNGEWEEFVEANAGDRLFRSYTIADEQIGRMLDAFPDSGVILVSDHGWTFSGYEHFGSPDGVIVAYGPGFRRGVTIAGARVTDVAPTLLALLDLPLSSELDGRVLESLFQNKPEIVDVAGYPDEILTPLDKATDWVNEAELERLRALGYLD